MRFYNEEEIITILRLAKEKGAIEAGKSLGVNSGTIAGWAKKSGIALPRKEKVKVDWSRIASMVG